MARSITKQFARCSTTPGARDNSQTRNPKMLDAMKIHPHKSVDSLFFHMSTAADAAVLYGPAQRICKNRDGLEEHHYDRFTLRFEARKGELRECTLLPYLEAQIGNVTVTWDITFLRSLCWMDGNPVDVHGFIVLNSIGIAVTGIHDGDRGQLAVTAFPQGGFDDLMDSAKPFDFRILGE